jgi:heptosyltransferase II
VVVNPGPGEDEEARLHYSAAHTIAGADLADYAALLERAALVVANDTGPGHMAAALGRPVISVLGPTEAARWRPWGPGVQVLQDLTGAGPDGTAATWPTAEAALQLAEKTLASAH